MTMDTEWVAGLAVIHIGGKLTVDHHASGLAAAVRALADEGRDAVLLDLDGVEYADSLGIEAIVASHISMAKKGGRLLVSGLSPRLRHLLEITRLSEILELYPDRARALEAISAGR